MASPNDVKKKGIDYSCSFVETNGRIDCCNSKYKKGEPSCVFCTICNEPKPVNNDTIKQGPCRHIYCEECIVNYVRERIKETLTQVKCPVSDCKEQILINEYFVPPEFMNQWMDTVREAEALFSCDIIECPYMDCEGYLIDDKRGFSIRTCPKCLDKFLW
uniref:Zinc finger protein n=1 Tax=Solanum tuberosum TaxID=4113 RepID=M1DSW8_SOLTU